MKSFVFFLLFYILLISNPLPVASQWVRQYPLNKLENVLDITVHADGFGYAVGTHDMILKLDPALKTWNLLTGLNKGWRLKAVDYLEGSNAQFVAAGGQGLIVSADAGLHWQEVSGAPAGIHAIKMLQATQFVVVADGGAFRYDGNQWTTLNLPVSSGVGGAFILDPDHIWCFTTGASAKIYSTSNGGNSWAMNDEIDGPDVVRFYNPQYGIALDGRKVFKSLDGGIQWTEVSNNIIHNSVNDITFGSGANILIAATLNGVPTISIDSGATWTQKPMGMILQRNYAVASFSDMEFWVGNDLSSITHTLDNGLTWREASGPERKVLNDIFFLNHNVGFSVGAQGGLLRTTNGGSHWEDISFDESRSYYCIHGLSANDLWIGGGQRILHSTDMGNNWQEKGIFQSGNINDILAVNPNRILACSSSGIIYRSEDGGASWDTVYQTNNQLRSLSRIETTKFMATGFNGIILRSVDSGETWNTVTIPEAGLQYEQAYFLGQDGWLVTSSFKRTMWHTSNGGDSWDAINLPIDRFWDGVFFMSPDTGIVVGRSNAEGRAYITYNGGLNWQSGYTTDFPLYGVAGIPNPNGRAWIHGFGSDIEILSSCTMLPLISNFIGENAPCENDTVTYSISSQDVDQYSWLFPIGWQILGNPNNDTVLVKVGRIAGTVTVNGSNSCGFTSPINVGVGPLLLPKIMNLTGDPTPCEGEIKTFSIVQTDVDNFLWNIPADWSIMGNSNQSSIMVQIGSMAGTISVLGSNSCGETQPVNLIVNPSLRPRMNGITGTTSPCPGEVAQYIADAELSDQIIWTFPADWQVIGDPNQTSILLQVGEASGDVTSTGVNACGLSATAEIDVAPLFIPDITLTANGNVLSLSLTGATYQWYLNGNPISGATGAEYVATESGDYSAVVILENGCAATTDALSIIISSVNHHDQFLPVSLFPVPVKESLFVKGIESPFTYVLQDLTGKILRSEESNENSISVFSLQQGIYLLKIEKDSRIYIGRFVKL